MCFANLGQYFVMLGPTIKGQVRSSLYIFHNIQYINYIKWSIIIMNNINVYIYNVMQVFV